MRTLATSLAVVVTVGLVAACSTGPPHARVAALARDLTVTLPPGSPQVTAQREPVTVKSRLVRMLAAPEHVTAAGQLPGKAVLTFHVGHVTGRPFLAWLDNGQWVAVTSTYNARAGTVSATVSHFSTWAPLTWISSKIKAWISSEIRNIFGLGTATDPNCGTVNVVRVTDSNQSHHTVGACAELAMALPSGNVLTRIANLRAYPVDLFYPPSVGKQCGEYGKCLQLTSQDDLWLKLGAALSPGSHRIMLPGSGSATAITDIPSGQTALFKTAVDSPAMFMAFLETGIGVFTSIVGTKVKAVATTAAALDTLTTSTCVSDAWHQYNGTLNIASAGSLARAAFSCLSSVLPDILDKLHLTAPALVLGAFTTATGLVSAVFSSLWGEYDTLFGAHELTVAGAPAGVPTTPTAANTYLVQGQDVNSPPLHRPSCRPGCVLSGDASTVLTDTSWSVWSGTDAVGTGFLSLETCTPNCASGGTFPPIPVVITLSHPVHDCSAQYGSGTTVLGGVRYFWTQVNWAYPKGLPVALRGASAPLNPWVWLGIADQANQSCNS